MPPVHMFTIEGTRSCRTYNGHHFEWQVALQLFPFSLSTMSGVMKGVGQFKRLALGDERVLHKTHDELVVMAYSSLLTMTMGALGTRMRPSLTPGCYDTLTPGCYDVSVVCGREAWSVDWG